MVKVACTKENLNTETRSKDAVECIFSGYRHVSAYIFITLFLQPY